MRSRHAGPFLFCERVMDASGTIDGKPMEIPGIGTFVMFKDTEGNRVGMLQPVPMEQK